MGIGDIPYRTFWCVFGCLLDVLYLKQFPGLGGFHSKLLKARLIQPFSPTIHVENLMVTYFYRVVLWMLVLTD